MAATYWLKQASDKPLFEELLWSKPENKRQAGKLLIVGGNLHGFAAPAEAYQASLKAGAGSIKVLLPDTLKKVVGPIIEHGEYAVSTPSGSFGQAALAELLDLSDWSDGVLLAGDFGRNSETAILLENFIAKSRVPVVLTKDSIDYFNHIAEKLVLKPQTTLVITMAQLQRLLKDLRYPKPVRFGMDLIALVDLLHELTSQYATNIVIKHGDQLIVATKGQVSSTKLPQELPVWRVKTAASISVWWLQNLSKPFEALTTAIFETTH